MGSPDSKIAFGTDGALSEVTEEGPPDRIIPRGLKVFSFSSDAEYGTISV